MRDEKQNVKRFWSLCEQTFLRVRALFLNREKASSKDWKRLLQTISSGSDESKTTSHNFFHWWKRRRESFSEVKKVITDLLFTIDFVCFLLTRTCESSYLRCRKTVSKPFCQAIFTVASSWFGARPNRLKLFSKSFSHWSERQNQTLEPLFVRHSTLSFCQTFSSTPVALSDI